MRYYEIINEIFDNPKIEEYLENDPLLKYDPNKDYKYRALLKLQKGPGLDGKFNFGPLVPITNVDKNTFNEYSNVNNPNEDNQIIYYFTTKQEYEEKRTIFMMSTPINLTNDSSDLFTLLTNYDKK